MEYIVAEFTINCEPALLEVARDLLADISAEAGFEAFESTDRGLNGYVQKTALKQSLLDADIADFPLEHTTVTYQLHSVESKNWNEQWEKAGFEPINIDDKVVIYDTRRESPHVPNGAVPISILPHQTFGTGTHQTTRMMIRSLLGIPVQGKRVVDCGCGTGILGITASKLGAAEVIGYDVDEWCVSNATHNAKENSVGNMTVLHGDSKVLDGIDKPFHVVMANINRNILLQDMPTFNKIMTPDAQLILSGFYQEDAKIILEKAARLKLREARRLTEDDWCCLTLTH